MKDRKQIRLEGYDYSLAGWYFVTFCTNTEDGALSTIDHDRAVLNPFGEIVDQNWHDIPNHLPLVQIDEHVVMPNHFHGIVILLNHQGKIPEVGLHFAWHHKDLKEGVEWRRHVASRHIKLLPKVLGGLKSVSSREIRKSGWQDFKWQRSYHDKIIRTEQELANVRQYIRTNPARWQEDPDCFPTSSKQQLLNHYEAILKGSFTNSTSNIQNSK